jgi:hypothetical protein
MGIFCKDGIEFLVNKGFSANSRLPNRWEDFHFSGIIVLNFEYNYY